MNFAPVSPKVFSTIQKLNIAEMAQCTVEEIRPLLPYLVRISPLPPLDGTKSWMENRKQLSSIMAGIEVVNNIVSLLQVSFHELEVDVKKKQQLRWVIEIVEILLYVNNGSPIICWVVANMPDCFREVVTALITNGDEDTPEGKLRLAALYELCDMNPGQALATRTICVEQTKMPSLMLKLSERPSKFGM